MWLSSGSDHNAVRRLPFRRWRSFLFPVSFPLRIKGGCEDPPAPADPLFFRDMSRRDVSSSQRQLDIKDAPICRFLGILLFTPPFPLRVSQGWNVPLFSSEELYVIVVSFLELSGVSFLQGIPQTLTEALRPVCSRVTLPPSCHFFFQRAHLFP